MLSVSYTCPTALSPLSPSDAENFNWCSVPLAGSDVFLFVSLALIAAAALFGKLSAVWVLVTGALAFWQCGWMSVVA